ncbi:type VII secretion target [Nocardia thailandica]|uniref:type VII secretion target n=1 Tax=Nocardia thailandica TaxID=257275 RepID=UPI0005BDB6A2|nr:type VII secretion target [Nocardia thailandica]
MGSQVKVDPDQLRKLGGNLTASSGKIKTLNKDISGWSFTAAQAGRAYGDEGTKFGAEIVNIGAWLTHWETAVAKSGTVYTTSANTYSSVDDANVTKIKAAGVNL